MLPQVPLASLASISLGEVRYVNDRVDYVDKPLSTKGSSETWAAVLRPEQARTIEEQARSLLDRFGYTRGQSGAGTVVERG